MVEALQISASGQMSVPGFAVLAVPAGEAARLLDRMLPADDHYAAVAVDDDPDLATT